MSDRPFKHLIFLHALRAVYAPIPKAGCSSIKAYLRRHAGLGETEDMAKLHGRQLNGFAYADQIERERLLVILTAKTGGYFKFTVCRNPYVRLYSTWNDLVRRQGDGRTRGGEAVEAVRLAYCRLTDRRPSEAPALDFEAFVQAIGACDPAGFDRHWQLQTVLSCSNLIRYDMTIKLEELDAAAARLAAALQIAEPIRHRLNVVTHAQENIAACYTEETKAIVQRVYARDFVRFRYDPEIVPEA